MCTTKGQEERVSIGVLCFGLNASDANHFRNFPVRTAKWKVENFAHSYMYIFSSSSFLFSLRFLIYI